jgi:acyl-homoserine-lactone acylase
VVLREVVDVGPDAAAGADGRFDLDELASLPGRNRVLSADLLLPGVAALCEEVSAVRVGADDVPIGPACAALAAWDRRSRVDSAGAILWRETVSAFGAGLSEHLQWADVFVQPFDPSDPLGTPHTAKWQGKGGKPSKLAVALAKAVQRLAKAGIAVDAPLGQWQFVPRGPDRLPVPGGMGPLGAFNIAGFAPGRDSSLLPTITRGKVLHGPSDLTVDGYVVNYGSSFLFAVTFDAHGPVGKHLLTYSQSVDPASPHHRDQTVRYASGGWLPLRWRDEDIAADPGLQVQQLSAPRP